jgi:uncharacterized protein YdaU (DUF1376 family)
MPWGQGDDMAEERAWMPIYWGDYFGDTRHLSTLEHGAYLILIGMYWRRGSALPADDKWLATACGMSRQLWPSVKKQVLAFFELRDGSYFHKRIEKEIVKANARSTAARTAGIASAQRRGNHSQSQSHAQSEDPMIRAKRILEERQKKHATPLDS